MPGLQALKDALFDTGDDQYAYECTDCDAQFTSAEPTVTTLVCPHCGSHSVRERAPAQG